MTLTSYPSEAAYHEAATHYTDAGIERDYGVWWTDETGQHCRVTWIETTRDVVAVHFGAGRNGRVTVLAENVPAEVAEAVLSDSETWTGQENGWASACGRGEDIMWVARRLAAWQHSQIVTYDGDDYAASEEKVARAFAVLNGYEGRTGGWIYPPASRSGRPVVQGWRSFYRVKRNGRALRVLTTDPERGSIIRRAAIQTRSR